MTIFKCKMCGGTIEFEQGATVGECDSCGTKQTLPRISDERRANLYDRANHFRRNNEFDKAAGIYEKILTDDNTDAEVYWSLVLCSYGIEYVEEPGSHKRVPTVNRAQFTSIFDDDNYKSALQYADGFQRELYEKEAKAINDIQKGILAISQKEEPFDVFICYKETDNNGRRTPDSVLANDLYHQLTQEGFKVFFSRITLEDKLGSAYEPYIFAALNSAKVMVVLGTKPEHFNAVWVKNEWSRYLALVKKSGGQKVLIPAYKDMDPYDLPEEFSHLQAQDMSKLGFMQDLIRGIKKLSGGSESASAARATVASNSSNANVAPLLKRVFMFLEDGNWKDADEYCERVLDQEPENGQAYLGKLLAELHVKRQDELPNCDTPFDKSNNYKKAVRFGGEKLASELAGYIVHINERNEKKRLFGIYNRAFNAMNEAYTEASYKDAAAIFRTISGFEDADTLYEQCLEKAETSRKDKIYSLALSSMDGSISGYERAIEVFESIPGWKEVDEQLASCQKKIEELKLKEEADRLAREREAEKQRKEAEEKAKREKRNMRNMLISAFVLLCLFFVVTIIHRHQQYNKAMALIDSGNYDAAYILLYKLGKNDEIKQNKQDRATKLIDVRDYDLAYRLLEEIGKNDEVVKNKYDRAKNLIDVGDNKAAYSLLKEIGKNDEIIQHKYDRAMKLINAKDYKSAYSLLEEIGKKDAIAQNKYERAKKLIDAKDFKTACILLDGIDYKDSAQMLIEAKSFLLKSLLFNASVGSIIRFGTYEQDNNTSNGKEPIEWIVLARERDYIFVVSKYALDEKYIGSGRFFRWDNCSLRRWLNEDFLDEAFSQVEQGLILKNTVKADNNPYYDTYPGDDTQDKVFLLSIVEVQKFFSSKNARKCKLTTYAVAHGGGCIMVDIHKGYCAYCLRTPGRYSMHVAYVDIGGTVCSDGIIGSSYPFFVRPALRIKYK